MIAKVHRVRIASLPPLESAYLRPSQWRHIDLNRALFAQSGGGRVDGSNERPSVCNFVQQAAYRARTKDEFKVSNSERGALCVTAKLAQQTTLWVRSDRDHRRRLAAHVRFCPKADE